MFSHIKRKVFYVCKRAYAFVEGAWFSKLVYENAPLVRFMDMYIGSECKYCMAARAMLLGAGIVTPNWIGATLIAVAIICAVAERTFKE